MKQLMSNLSREADLSPALWPMNMYPKKLEGAAVGRVGKRVNFHPPRPREVKWSPELTELNSENVGTGRLLPPREGPSP